MRVRFFTALLGLSICGCAATQDYHYLLVQKHRASAAWTENYGRLGHQCSRDYQDGWKRGYYDLSTGQCEEPPPVPPHKYWEPKYQSLDGKQAIADWYSGWQDGATAAVQNGSPYFHEIGFSPTPPVNNLGPHQFHGGGEMGGEMHSAPVLRNEVPRPNSFESLPPIPPADPMPIPPAPPHEPQPQVYIGPAQPRFANHEADDELLAEEDFVPAPPAPVRNARPTPLPPLPPAPALNVQPAPQQLAPIVTRASQDLNAPPPVDLNGSFELMDDEELSDEAEYE